jgi:hypothetical protein
MSIFQFQGMFLPPGMGLEAYSTEVDFSSIIYGPLHHCVLAPYAMIASTSADAGNTGNTNVLRGGLVMARATATSGNTRAGEWLPFASGGANGAGVARGILLWSGLTLAKEGTTEKRFMGAILVKGNVQASGVCLAATAGWGLPKTAAGLKVRQDLLYNIMFDDDPTAALSRPTPI